MVTAKETVKEQVPGLQQSPVEGGKFVIRKVKETTTEDVTGTGAVQSYDRELVLVIKGEDEYSTPLFNYDDGSIVNATYTVINNRRTQLRNKLIEANDEVELTN